MMITKKGRPENEELQELLDLIDPEDFLDWLGVDYRVTRGRSGTQLNIKTCPRCGGSDRKVYLNAESGLGSCFHGACVGEPGFNIFSFTRHHCGGGREAVDQLKLYATTVGWKPKAKSQARISPDVTSDDLVLPESHPLPIKGRNLSYLQARGIGIEVIQYLGWRFCDKGFFAYTNPEGNPARQDYSKRVIIPVRDMDGVIRTFQGRDITGTSERRYLFPPGVAGTGRFLYNANQARGAETIVLVEGAFDAAATIQALAEDKTQSVGVVGTFGKKISMGVSGEFDQLTQLYQLKQEGARRFIIMWDGEPQTIATACDEGLALARLGFEVYIALLPTGKDPNEVPALTVRKAIREAHRLTPMWVSSFKLRQLSARS